MNPHNRLVTLAEEAIENVFSDATADTDTILESLEELAVEIELKIKALHDKLERESARK